MKTLIEKLRALAETEKNATPGPWETSATHIWSPSEKANVASASEPQGIKEVGYDEPKRGTGGLKIAYRNAALIADSRTLLKEFLESWFVQHAALENLINNCRVHQTAPPDYAWSECICGREDHHEPDCPVEAARKALNLATTPHP